MAYPNGGAGRSNPSWLATLAFAFTAAISVGGMIWSYSERWADLSQKIEVLRTRQIINEAHIQNLESEVGLMRRELDQRWRNVK